MYPLARRYLPCSHCASLIVRALLSPQLHARTHALTYARTTRTHAHTARAEPETTKHHQSTNEHHIRVRQRSELPPFLFSAAPVPCHCHWSPSAARTQAPTPLLNWPTSQRPLKFLPYTPRCPHLPSGFLHRRRQGQGRRSPAVSFKRSCGCGCET